MIRKEQVQSEIIVGENGENGVAVQIELTSSSSSSCQEREREREIKVRVSEVWRGEDDGAKTLFH